MNLGGVAVYQGDEVLARDCYIRATNIDFHAAKTIAETLQRLDLMATMKTSRGLRPKGE